MVSLQEFPDPARRDDIRQAVNTLMLLSAQVQLDELQREQIVRALIDYLDLEPEQSAEDAAAMFREMMRCRYGRDAMEGRARSVAIS